jgi:four helix bundle protein
MTIDRFEQLVIWQLGREFAQEIYILTKEPCWKEDLDFRNQIRSSSGSIPDNIAEGFEREGNNEFVQFLSIAKGSCGESRSQIYRAFDREYFSKEKSEDLVRKSETLSVKIHNTMTSAKKSDFRGNKFKKI